MTMPLRGASGRMCMVGRSRCVLRAGHPRIDAGIGGHQLDQPEFVGSGDLEQVLVRPARCSNRASRRCRSPVLAEPHAGGGAREHASRQRPAADDTGASPRTTSKRGVAARSGFRSARRDSRHQQRAPFVSSGLLHLLIGLGDHLHGAGRLLGRRGDQRLAAPAPAPSAPASAGRW